MDLAALVARLGLAGRVEGGLAKAGIRSLADFVHVRSEDDFIAVTSLPPITARSLYSAVRSPARPRGGTLPAMSMQGLRFPAVASAASAPQPMPAPLATKVSPFDVVLYYASLTDNLVEWTL